MKRSVCFWSMVVALMVPGLLKAEDAPVQGPRIACDEPLFDFGTVDNSQTIEHTFIVRNIGDTTLEISQVRPACGCTLANISEKMVPPGGQSEITARLSLQGRNGPQSKPITIMSNDPQQPEFRVTLAGNVSAAIQVAPERLMFGQIGQGRSAEQTVSINSLNQESFNITDINSSTPELTHELETVEAGKHYNIKFTLTGPSQPGPVNAVVLVTTDNPNRQTITIPVIANVVGALIFAPSAIELPASAGEQPVTRYIVIRPGTMGAFQIKEVKLPDPAMRASIYPFGDQGYRIQIENIRVSPDLTGKSIVIETTGSENSTVEIPLRVQ